MAVNTYYFDASDAGPTDPGVAWLNDANAFDSDATPSTFATTAAVGSTASNYLMAEGTNAPTTGGTITQVRARFNYDDAAGGTYGDKSAAIYTDGLAEELGNFDAQTNNSSSQVWTSYITLSTPSGGWTWQKVKNLEIKLYSLLAATGNYYKAEVEVTSEDAVRNLSFKANINGGSNLRPSIFTPGLAR